MNSNCSLCPLDSGAKATAVVAVRRTGDAVDSLYCERHWKAYPLKRQFKRVVWLNDHAAPERNMDDGHQQRTLDSQ